MTHFAPESSATIQQLSIYHRIKLLSFYAVSHNPIRRKYQYITNDMSTFVTKKKIKKIKLQREQAFSSNLWRKDKII